MPEPTPHSLTQFFSALAGKDVNFSLAPSTSAQPKAPLIFGLYSVLPDARPMVVRMSLRTLALLGGALLGLPEDTAIERAGQTPMDEPLRDAMHEVLNITSTAITSDQRVVFQKMGRDLKELPPEAGQIAATATRKNAYTVTVGSYAEVFNVLQ